MKKTDAFNLVGEILEGGNLVMISPYVIDEDGEERLEFKILVPDVKFLNDVKFNMIIDHRKKYNCRAAFEDGVLIYG